MSNNQGSNAYFADVILSAEQNFIQPEQMEKALEACETQRVSLLEYLVAEKICGKEEVLTIIGDHFVMPIVCPASTPIDQDVIDAFPYELVRKYGVMPVFKDGNVLSIAVDDPLDFDVVDNLKFHTSYDIEIMLALGSEIDECIKVYYEQNQSEGFLDKMQELEDADVDNIEMLKDEEEKTDDDAPVIKLVSLIIIEAFKNRASDIHFEPMGNRFRVRYRIDGMLQEVSGPPKRLQSSVISRLKIMAGMSIAEKRLPQDGRIKLNILGKEIDLRVSSIPIVYGESIVLRILDKSGVVLGLAEVGFSARDQKIFEQLIGMPNGIVLITGPTGSGKTSTLYSALSYLNKPNRKIITVEDPIEYQLSGINQVQVAAGIGRTFPVVLRSMLRQAPNVIMIGEIRDTEVANIAINAALTGHLVFSTLHTNDAASSISRLIDQGVKPYLVSSSLRAVLAQRLIRKICPKCKEPTQPREEHLIGLGLSPAESAKMTFYKGAGCPYCSGTGYRGRCGIFELFIIDDAVREMIYEKKDSDAIKKRAVQAGMKTLMMDGVDKVAAGMSTVEEVLRVTKA